MQFLADWISVEERKGENSMNIIAAVDRNWAIGYKGGLLVQIPADQKYFREMTKGKVIVLGRKTLETFPNAIPLPQRTNIILSEDKDFLVRGGLVVHSIKEAREELKKYREDDIFIVGGSSIYQQFLPYCNVAYITKIDYTYQADRYMPNLDQDRAWQIAADSEEQTYFDLEYYFYRYERKKLFD